MLGKEPKGLSVKDYEDSLRSCVAQLLIVYKHNGGDESERVVARLLECIHSLSTYLEELSAAVLDTCGEVSPEKEKALLDIIRPVLDVIQGKGEVKDGER